MCLVVNLGFHRVQDAVRPFIAQHDFLVWKIVKKTLINGGLYTPYMNYPLFGWDNGCCTLYSELGINGTIEDNIAKVCVDQGIHSYYIKGSFAAHITHEVTSNGDRFLLLPAIIPRGASFLIGDAEDIVSTELQIYIDEDHLPKDVYTIPQCILEFDQQYMLNQDGKI